MGSGYVTQTRPTILNIKRLLFAFICVHLWTKLFFFMRTLLTDFSLPRQFCRAGIVRHHGMSNGCILSGNARPTLLQTYNCFFSRSLRSSRTVFYFLYVSIHGRFCPVTVNYSASGLTRRFPGFFEIADNRFQGTVLYRNNST